MDRTRIAAGDLRFTVSIEGKEASGTGTRGEPLFTWVAKLSRRANVESLTGRKAEIARQLVPTATHTVVVRYSPLIAVTDRVLFRGRVFNVGHLDDVGERHTRLELTCTEEV